MPEQDAPPPEINWENYKELFPFNMEETADTVLAEIE